MGSGKHSVHSAQRFVFSHAEPDHDLHGLRVGVAFALGGACVTSRMVAEDVVAPSSFTTSAGAVCETWCAPACASASRWRSPVTAPGPSSIATTSPARRSSRRHATDKSVRQCAARAEQRGAAPRGERQRREGESGESGPVSGERHRDSASNSAINGAPGRSRTCDPRIRSPMLYPTELRAHWREPSAT